MHHPPLTLRCKETRKTLPAVVETVDQDHQAGIASTVSKSVKRSSLFAIRGGGLLEGYPSVHKTHRSNQSFVLFRNFRNFSLTSLFWFNLHHIAFHRGLASV